MLSVSIFLNGGEMENMPVQYFSFVIMLGTLAGVILQIISLRKKK